MKKKLIIGSAVIVLAGITLMIPVGGYDADESAIKKVKPMDLANFNTDKPSKPLRLFFIHHSCGGQLFAPSGPDVGKFCIYESHPNGGNLRARLIEQGYTIREASYGSELGEDTDLFDWLPKFQNKMEKILTAAGPDIYDTDAKNDIVAFKSCFPNSRFVAKGEAPGNKNGPELTVANAKASYTALRDELAKHPEVLFVAVTAPPDIGSRPAEPLWKVLARIATGKQLTDTAISGPLAREFNNWLKSPDGWLMGYPHKNVAVFDYYDILTGTGESNFLKYPSGPNDPHPNAAGNAAAAKAFLPFINAAVRRAGLSE